MIQRNRRTITKHKSLKLKALADEKQWSRCFERIAKKHWQKNSTRSMSKESGLSTQFEFSGNNPDCSENWNLARIHNEGYSYKLEFVASLIFDDIIEYIRKHFSITKIFEFENLAHIEVVTSGKDVMIKVIDSDIDVFAKTQDVLFATANKLSSLKKIKGQSFKINYYYMTAGGPRHHYLLLSKEKVEDVYPELYPGIDVDCLAKDFQSSSDKVLLLYGIPGVGKTSFVRYLIKNYIEKEEIVYVKDPAVLESSSFWADMSTDEYDYLIFDDLVTSLGPREENKDSNFVSELLSYTSGVLEQTSAKVIITTNEPIKKIDEALLRPGRCFDFIVLEPLSFEEGLYAWTNKLEQDAAIFEEKYAGKKEITQAELMSDYSHAISKSQARRYLKKGRDKLSLSERVSSLTQNGLGYRIS